jgi:hypothetical protein
MPSLFEIYLVQTQWRYSSDRRPALIVQILSDNQFLCALMSSAIDLFDNQNLERGNQTAEEFERGHDIQDGERS